MGDLSSYRDKVADAGKRAKQCEDVKDYEGAFEWYTKALDIFKHLMTCKFKKS